MHLFGLEMVWDVFLVPLLGRQVPQKLNLGNFSHGWIWIADTFDGFD